MRITEILTEEHRVIEQVLECLEAMASEAEAAGRLDGAAARQAVDFFQNFADRCHHGKEESHLFPMLERQGIAHGNCLAPMAPQKGRASWVSGGRG